MERVRRGEMVYADYRSTLDSAVYFRYTTTSGQQSIHLSDGYLMK